MARKAAFAGIDLGTTGIRVILADEEGTILSVHSENILDSTVPTDDEKKSEQELDKLAREVYPHIVRMLAIERERRIGRW